MSASVRWDGLEELMAELRSLPDDLAAEASGIVVGAANDAKDEIYDAYPERTRHLKEGLFVRVREGQRYGVGAIVVNKAPHAWMFENGTNARHTDLGIDRGSAPPGHVFIPIVMRRRRAMYEQLRGLLTRHGLAVSGDA